jgi:SAM-dependent methyltransferase
MRSKGLPAVAATAEAIPLRSECAGVATAAQAFHWFEPGKAVPEMRRVVRPDGRVVLVWNFRDETVEWVRQLSAIIGSEDAMVATIGGQDEFEMEIRSQLLEGGHFGSVEHKVFPHDQQIDEEGLLGLVRSRSYVAILPDPEKEQLLARVRRLCSEHPALVGRATFHMPYRTRVFRATPA